MSRRESNIDRSYIDTEYSSGDSQRMNPKHCQEENNNDVDSLSKEFTEMGCIVDAVQRPPNICVESCVHEDSENEQTPKNNDEDAYSDEFEEDKSDDDVIKEEDEDSREEVAVSARKLTKSQSSTSTNMAPRSIAGSTKSSGYGSICAQRNTRVNMSFSNDRLREIERHNHILLNKIVSARNVRKSSIPPASAQQAWIKPVPSAALHRKRAQKKIDHDNMILLKKLQSAKSSACSIRR